jgi:predicted DsbA family dithiol-disulfide isomerase
MAQGAAEGIKLSLKGKMGYTRDAHRLVQLAKTKSNQVENRVVSALYRSHFEDDQDITSQDMLIAAGEEGGLDRNEVKKWLDDGCGRDTVDREVHEAFMQAMQERPHFNINGRYRFGGVDDSDVFIQFFHLAKESGPDLSVKRYAGIGF